MLTHRGGCHCGAVAFEVDAPAQLEVVECNCSICGPAAYRHLIVPKERFRLLRGMDALASYRFGTHTARHLFCRICGVKSFYVPRSHPEGVSVNARCLAPETVASIRVQPFDGANWEEHRNELATSPPARSETRAHPSHAELVREIGLPQRSRAGSLEAVLAVADALPRGRALDVPCGPGLASEALRRLGFEVTAADLDEKAFAASPEIRFEKLDLDLPLPFADASFELVHCGDGIEHLESPIRALRELARVLAPGGTLLLTTPNYSSLERRLRFLLSGSLAKPLPRAGPGAARDERGHGHLSPLTLTQLCWMAEHGGLALVSARTLLRMPRQRLLAPLALPALLYRALLSPERRRDLFAEQSGSLGVLLGGRKLLLVFGKRTEPRGAAADSASLRAMQHVDVERRFEAPKRMTYRVVRGGLAGRGFAT